MTTQPTAEEPHPGRLEARVHGDVRNLSGFHAAHNIPNNPICGKSIVVSLESQNARRALQRKPTVVTQELLARLLGARKQTRELEFVSGGVGWGRRRAHVHQRHTVTDGGCLCVTMTDELTSSFSCAHESMQKIPCQKRL